MRRLGLVLLVAALASGCLRSTTTITVKQDGSGTMDQEIGATPQALALLRSFGSGGAGDKPGNVQMFGPEQAAAAAASMGVRFVSGEPIKTAETEGYRAHFAFDDVTKLKFDMVKTPGPAAEKNATPPFGFGFTKGATSSVLTINMPEQQSGPASLLNQLPGGGAQSQDNQQALAMLMPMLHGLYVDVTLNVDGRVIKTNAPYVARIAGHAAAVRFRQGECHGGRAAEAADHQRSEAPQGHSRRADGDRAGRHDRVRPLTRSPSDRVILF